MQVQTLSLPWGWGGCGSHINAHNSFSTPHPIFLGKKQQRKPTKAESSPNLIFFQEYMASLALEKQQIEAELEDPPADTESWRRDVEVMFVF